MNLPLHRALQVLQEAGYQASFYPFLCCTSQPPKGKANWTAPVQFPPELSPLPALLYVCSSDLRRGTISRHLYKAEI